MELREQLTTNEVGVKYKSKKELYKLLSTEGNLYLPPMLATNKGYLSGVMMGDKKCVTCEDVRVIKVPQIEGLTIKEILEFARSKINIKEYLPEYDYEREHNREWLWNVIHSLLGESFRKHVEKKWKEREKKLLEKKNLNTQTLPQFTKLFKESSSVKLKRENLTSSQGKLTSQGSLFCWKRKLLLISKQKEESKNLKAS